MRQFEHPLQPESQPRIIPVEGGHMKYQRVLIESDEGDLHFAKLHDSSQFTDPDRERHSREYLVKEHAMMQHLRQQRFAHVPCYSQLTDDHSLFMEGLSTDDGWHWRAPSKHIDAYIADVTNALSQLEGTPHPDQFLDSHAPAHEAFILEGWSEFDSSHLQEITTRLQVAHPKLRPDFQHAAQHLAANLTELQSRPLPTTTPTTLCHHDLRQANLAWHPEHGVRIVDWSWTGIGLKQADSTSLLVDLHKSGHDILRHLAAHFNPEHAHLQLGYLLSRAIAPSHDEFSAVRFHQLVSAVSTFDLLQLHEATQ